MGRADGVIHYKQSVQQREMLSMKKLIYMKKSQIIFSIALLVLSGCRADKPSKPQSNAKKENPVVYLTNETFKEKVFNYDISREWKYAGTKPAIIDFYASWCGPCKLLSPVIEDLAREYNGRIVVYKVDTDKERMLAQKLGVQALPTILLIPAEGHPQTIMGLLPKADLVKAIQEVLLD
jgi:thioredoxin 1